jgi:hypothetical protein
MPTPKSKLSKLIPSLPSTLSGAHVVERVQAKGMKTSRANVSRVRGVYGSKAVKTSATVTSTPSKTVAAKPTAPARNKSPQPRPPLKTFFALSRRSLPKLPIRSFF